MIAHSLHLYVGERCIEYDIILLFNIYLEKYLKSEKKRP